VVGAAVVVEATAVTIGAPVVVVTTVSMRSVDSTSTNAMAAPSRGAVSSTSLCPSVVFPTAPIRSSALTGVAIFAHSGQPLSDFATRFARPGAFAGSMEFGGGKFIARPV
jgi:hypothetical protein